MCTLDCCSLAVASGDSGTAPAPAALNERRTADALNRM